jgi:hypothetical protein
MQVSRLSLTATSLAVAPESGSGRGAALPDRPLDQLGAISQWDLVAGAELGKLLG